MYADDISIRLQNKSFNNKEICSFLTLTHRHLSIENFYTNPAKTKFMNYLNPRNVTFTIIFYMVGLQIITSPSLYDWSTTSHL